MNGQVPKAVRTIEQLSGRGREMADVGRAAALVVYHVNFWTIRRKLQNRIRKALPSRTEQP